MRKLNSPRLSPLVKLPLLSVLLLAAGAADAQEPVVGPPLVNPAGALILDGNVDVNLSTSVVGKPVWITPNIYYGVSERLTLGIVHGAWEDILGAGGGFCVGGAHAGCGPVYDNIGLDALLSVIRPPGFELAAHLGLDYLSIDHGWWGVHGGVAIKYRAGALALFADPAIFVRANKRGQDLVVSNGRGNTESLAVPVRLALEAGPVVTVFLDVAFAAPFDRFGDYYTIPVGVGGMVSVSSTVDLGARFQFSNLAGKNHSTDGRDGMLLFRVHP